MVFLDAGEMYIATLEQGFSVLLIYQIPLSNEVQQVIFIGVSFFDAATVAEPGIDNVHLDIEGHKKFAIALSKAIKTILNQID